MKVLAFVTQKGGTGKSSLAISVAVAAHERGREVALIDLDPQGTAAGWFERRLGDVPVVMRRHWRQLGAAINDLYDEGYQIVIIDTPAGNSSATSAAIHEADFCLVPVRPSVVDIDAAKTTIWSLEERGKHYAFVLNQCPAGGMTPRTQHVFRALQVVSAVSDVMLASRSDHLDAIGAGLGVTEYNRSGKAAGEVRALLDWVLARWERSDSVA